ncbi:MAG: hypothetical protein KC501_06165 [Myxococcales bacterium]|nr:hypothetical protein [Myxococcales bacterium]
MHRAWPFVALVLGLPALACSGGDTSKESSTAASLGDSSSTAADGEESSSTTSGGTSQSGDATTTTPPPDDGTSSGDEAGSSSEGCVPGTEGCRCAEGELCNGELVCVGGTCSPAQCDGDVFEPNDDEGSAFFLGMINDNDGNGGIVSASLHVPGDVDWFSYQGDDDITGNVDPARALVSSTGVRLCKFLECDNGLGQTEFECPVGSQYAFSPEGRPGCCANGDVALPDLDCDGVIEDNAMVYIRIDEPEEACVTYSVSYHY